MHGVNAISKEERMRRKKAFNQILIQHPRFGTIKQRTQSLVEDTEVRIAENEERAQAAKGRPIKHKELWVLPIVGPSGATKSTSMSYIVDEINGDPSLAERETPILYVTLDQNTRGPKQLQVQILEAFADPSAETVLRAAQHSTPVINEDIRRIAIERKTRVIVLDEAGNMLMHDAGKIGRQMANAIKGLVNEAIFSVILMGTEEVNQLFMLSPELQSRNCGAVNVGRFDVRRKEDRDYFFGFVDRFEKRLLSDKIIDRPLGLVGDVVSRASVYDFADGIIGIVPRVLLIALNDVLAQGRGYLEWEDVANAFHSWNLPRSAKEKHYDPFGENGPKKPTLAFVREDTKPRKKPAA
jgi:hypothetical protein